MTQLLPSSPAGSRLEWLLAGLSGRWPARIDAAGVLDPAFTAYVPAERFVHVMVERSQSLAPITVIGVDVEAEEATARFRSRTGERWVAKVVTAPEKPHRIVSAYASPWVPDYLAPPLPDCFEAPVDSTRASRTGTSATPDRSMPRLIVFSGVPGSGKSTVAERVGTALGAPVFALDWMLGALSPFGLRHRSDLMPIGEELLVTLAYRQLGAGGTAILDATIENPSSRQRLRSLATAFDIRFQAVVCVCSDRALHRQRVEQRRRGIPGWHDAGDWDNVERRLAAFPAWPGALELDTAQPVESCVRTVLSAVDPMG